MAESSQNPKPDKNGSSSADRVQPVRSRTWRACLTCRKRKVKCNGQEPCSYCISSGKVCTFQDISDNASLARQQANTIDNRLTKVEDTLQKFVPMVEAFDSWLRNLPPSASKSELLNKALPFQLPNEPEGKSSLSRSPAPRPSDTPYKPSPAIQRLFPQTPAAQSPLSLRSPLSQAGDINEGPERWPDRFSHLTKDSYGNLRYIGGTSSLMLVDALTSLQDQQPDASPESFPSSKSSAEIQLPFFNPNGRFRATEALPRPEDIKYPSAELADELVSTYFSRIHHTFPILHQQLFIEKYTSIMEAYAAGRPSNDSASLSVVFAVFACGACVTERYKSTDQVILTGMDFYERAQLLFWIAYGAAQIEHVQCLALMAICNASWNTLAQSWINAGQAIRRAQDMGLHRVTRRSPLTPLDKEIRRRVWWCVYGLDKALSIALGRPSGTHDDDCNVELPLELEDDQLLEFCDGKTIPQSDKPSYMTGFVALLRIYIVAGKIVRFVQSTKIEDPKTEQIQNTVRQLDAELETWFNELPPGVRYAPNDSGNPQMLVLCLITFFVYYSSIINLHRPFIPDRLDASTDLTSLSRCLSAARSCIRIGNLSQQMLPTSHHLAYCVQYITLSGVLLLRCVLFVSQGTLVSAMIQDAEKCIKILEVMEEIWPASKRCREIVSDLLIVVRTKLYGGPSAISDLRAAQNNRSANSDTSNHPSPSDSSRGKRKRSHEGDNEPSSSRPRLDGYNNWPKTPAINGQTHGNYPPRFSDGDAADGRPHRVSNLRTSMDSSMVSAGHLAHHPVELPQLHHPSALPAAHMGPPPPPPLLPPPHDVLMGNPRGYASPPPQISLDLNAPGREIEGLPYSGYDFLGDDLFAVLGNVMKSPSETGPHHEEHSQALWQAFSGHQDPPFISRTAS